MGSLFEVNPDIDKRIADIDFGDTYNGRVEPGWLLLARSGQIYGLNGSLALATIAHTEKVVSDDVIRISPDSPAKMRAGYVYIALSHPTLGRALVKSIAYGSSIPHIDPTDVAEIQVVHLASTDENYIADQVEQAAEARAQADLLENAMADEAEQILSRFIAGET